MTTGLGLWPYQDELHERLRGTTIYVLDTLTSDTARFWRPLTARFLVCPNCGERYEGRADTLSGYAMEWMPTEDDGKFVLFCTCGKVFPEENWLANDDKPEGATT